MPKSINNAKNIDVLFVGGGPASLAGAIRLKQLLKEHNRDESVVVIEKGNRIGNHTLSGAIFDAGVLDDLLPDWRQEEHPVTKKMLQNKVRKDSMYFLTGHFAIKIPHFITPSPMHNKGYYAISISELSRMLTDVARKHGVEVYTGFAARDVLVKDGYVKGIKLGEKGRNEEGEKQANYLPGEELTANVTVFGNGCLDPLSERLMDKMEMASGKNPQIYSVGVKEIIKLPEDNKFGENRIIHTMGFPLKRDVFGGGTMYSMGDNHLAIAIILGLDWGYCNLNPHQELQIFKSHRFVKKFIEGGEVTAYGAKTIPEGGYYSIPELTANGAVIIGDSAGLVDIRKMKGLHLAMKSGVSAAEAIMSAIQSGDFSKASLNKYPEAMNQSDVVKDLHKGKNYRQIFSKTWRAGVYLGAPLSVMQRLIPFRLKTKPDYESMNKTKLKRKYDGGTDRLTDVSFSGTIHREEQPSHIRFADSNDCKSCEAEFGLNPCVFFCPGEVYRNEAHSVILSPSNCLHCKTCRVKCPHQNIVWEVPEAGEGPKYKGM